MYGSGFRKQRSKAEIHNEFNDILASIGSETCLSLTVLPEDNEDEVVDASLFVGMDEEVFTDAKGDVSIEVMLLSLEDFSVKEGIDIKSRDKMVEKKERYKLEHSKKMMLVQDQAHTNGDARNHKKYLNQNDNNGHDSGEKMTIVGNSNSRDNHQNAKSDVNNKLICGKVTYEENDNRNNDIDSTNDEDNKRNNKSEISNKNSNNGTYNRKQVLFSITNFDFDLDTLIEGMDPEKNIEIPQGTVSRKPLIDFRASSSTSSGGTSQQSSFDYDDDDGEGDSDVVLTFSVTSPYVMTTNDVKTRLQALYAQIWSTDEDKNEATTTKGKKIQLALEKMEQTSFEKLFIKVYRKDQRSHQVMMIDKAWTARDVMNNMVYESADTIEPSPNWCIVEKIPQLSLDRIMEDSESVLDTVMEWSNDTDNILMLSNRRGKYSLFNDPCRFLSLQHGDVNQSKEHVLKEFFSHHYTHVPKAEGNLWLRTGNKKWTKLFFALRSSGIYYNPEGKKPSKKMVCLAMYENIRVYSGLRFHKKFRSPSKYVFCLKPSKVQDMTSKDIHLLCAEDVDSKVQWMCDIRLAKYGSTMYQDYLKTREDEARRKRGWSSSSGLRV